MNYQVAVRTLTEFTAKQGDLDLRFSPAPSAEEGMAGHATVTARRPSHYQREVSLTGQYRHLLVRGRADGYDPQRNRLEEIKTYRGDFERIPANHRHLHWAQAKIYGWLLCDKLGLSGIEVALVYFDVGRQTETVLSEACTAQALQAFFEQQCERFLAWAEQELTHRAARDAALAGLAFPHASFRTGQRQLAETVYRAARTGRCLMAQAPTGIGKTIGTLFPMLKAMPEQKLDKVCFLTAKTPGRALGLDAMTRLRETGAPLRVLELVARDKACEHPDKACHGDSCPLAQGFYDRLPDARDAAVRHRRLHKDDVRDIALTHRVCPYYLSQDLARWADVIVGDYNYYFDSSAMLHALAEANQWRLGLLIDEAHNLPERGRAMYSAELDQGAARLLRKAGPAALQKEFERLNRSWNALAREQETPYRVKQEIPSSFSHALQRANAAIGAFYAEHPSHADPVMQRFYFDALHFARLMESFGTHSLFDITLASGQKGRTATLGIRNVIPAPFLAPRFAAAPACILFSATLTPWHFYADVLGLPADVGWVEVASPFAADQLEVRIASTISTRYRDRADSLDAIVRLIGATYLARPGNYLAFFSSFDYLRQAVGEVRQHYPQIPVWEQSRGMDEAARDAFLAQFVADGQGIGFAVLGGAFAEGIDLEGERLVGAFIATLGLPQMNAFNEEVRKRMDATFGAGYDYTYLFPGLRKVVQAAGRVIRSPEDRGLVVLMDDRYARAHVQDLLPTWWKLDEG